MPKDEEIRQMMGDPVDAANDAGLLSIVLDRRAQAIAADALAALAIRDARGRQ